MTTSGFSWDDDTRHTLRQGNDILERTGQSLVRSHQVAVETEEIGASVVSELGEQRETLLRAKQRLTNTNAELSRSRAILRKMTLHVLTNKLILIVIIFLEMCILGTVIYLRFFNK